MSVGVRLGYWNKLRERRLEIFVISWGYRGHREKGGHSWFPAAELGMILAELELRINNHGGGLLLAYLSSWGELLLGYH